MLSVLYTGHNVQREMFFVLFAAGGVESSITNAASKTVQKLSTHVTSQLTEHLFEDSMGNATIWLDTVSILCI